MEYVIGVDGGGTRTICLLADLEGNIYGHGLDGPSNFQAVGVAEALTAIKRASENAVAGLNLLSFPIEAICLGLAGVETPQDEALISEHVESMNIARRVYVVNDTEIALIGGLGGERGVVVVAGTGSAAFGCDEKEHKARAGGWGWMLGDEGSAFDISRQGLRAVVQALEGRGKDTSLVETLIRRWNLTNREELFASLRACTWTRGEMASLAEWVTEAARGGDVIARQIITYAGEELGMLATTVINQLQMSGEFGVALTGGVFQAGEMVSKPLRRKVHTVSPAARLMSPLYPPVLGAIFMAWRNLGLSLDVERMERAHSNARAKSQITPPVW